MIIIIIIIGISITKLYYILYMTEQKTVSRG